MRKENLEIIEAARRLGIRLTGQQGPNCVQITGDASQFPGRLMALQQAIDAYDKASASGGVPDEVDRLKKGIDGIFKWLRSNAIDVTEPMEIVGDALGVPPELRRRRELVPDCVPAYGRRRTGGKMGGGGRTVALQGAMGAVLARDPEQRVRRKPFKVTKESDQ